MLGALNYETGQVICIEEGKHDVHVFLHFLEKVIEFYPSGKIVMILDNSRIHHAKLLQPFLAKYSDRLTLKFLPPYSPKLNLIESLWCWLKNDTINNVFFSSEKKIKIAVRNFIDYVNKTPEKVLQRLCFRMYIL